jgi:uncharacterized protein (DUF58 family)
MTTKKPKDKTAGVGIALLAIVSLAILFIAITNDTLLTLALLFVGVITLGYCLLKSAELRTLTRQATTLVFSSISQVVREYRAQQAAPAKPTAKAKPVTKPKPAKKEVII